MLTIYYKCYIIKNDNIKIEKEDNNMDFKSAKNKAIELYQKGATVQEINKKVGITLTEDTIQKWIIDDKYNSYKYIIFKLQKKQKAEQDIEKRRPILLELKQQLEAVLEIVPNDMDMQTKLMYTNISLKDIEAARKIGYELLEKTDSREVLNGIAIIEEKTGNYDKAIEMIEKMLSSDPNNEYYKSKKQRLQNKKESRENNEKDKMYAQMATLERSAKKIIERKQGEITLQGKEANIKKITNEVYQDVYSRIKEISESMLERFPEDVIAKEKLVKSLYLIGEKDIAKSRGEEFLQTNNNDEIILWYMCKIERDKGNLQGEKEYLQKLVDISSQELPLKVMQRLERVNLILEKQAEELKEEKQGKTFTEEDRQVWIENIQKQFQEGKISLEDIDNINKEARKYPNYIKSFIAILDLKTKITEDFQSEIEELDKYLETEYSVSKEDYKLILDEMTKIKNQIDSKRIANNYYDSQDSNGGDER